MRAASPPTPAVLLLVSAADATADSNFTSVFTLTAAGARCCCREGCAAADGIASRFTCTRTAGATPREASFGPPSFDAVAGRAEGGRVLLLKCIVKGVSRTTF